MNTRVRNAIRVYSSGGFSFHLYVRARTVDFRSHRMTRTEGKPRARQHTIRVRSTGGGWKHEAQMPTLWGLSAVEPCVLEDYTRFRDTWRQPGVLGVGGITEEEGMLWLDGCQRRSTDRVSPRAFQVISWYIRYLPNPSRASRQPGHGSRSKHTKIEMRLTNQCTSETRVGARFKSFYPEHVRSPTSLPRAAAHKQGRSPRCCANQFNGDTGTRS